MKHCLDCQSEYRDEFDVCADCEKPLSEGPLPEIPDVPARDVPWKVFRECDSDFDAELWRQILEENHIPVLRKSTFRGSYMAMGGTGNWPGNRTILLIPEDKADRAKQLWHERIQAGHRLNSAIRSHGIGGKALVLKRKGLLRKKAVKGI